MWWLLLVILAILSYVFLWRSFSFWRKNHVAQDSPNNVLIDLLKSFLQTEYTGDFVNRLYNLFPTSRYVGVYQFLQPTIMLRDPELIKQFTVKHFENFMDHGGFVPEDLEPLWGENLFNLKGKKWKDMRVTLSPAFTSSKIRMMFSLMCENGEQFVRHFLEKKEKTVEVEMKDVFSRFTNDAIASSAFGIECDSLKNPENEIYRMLKKTTDLRGFVMFVKMVIGLVAPQISKVLNLRVFSQEVVNFFYSLVNDTTSIREKNKIFRPDLIHLLMQAQKKELVEEEISSNQDAGFAAAHESLLEKTKKLDLTNKQMASQVFIFFFAGFETASTLMCFVSYELAINPEIQDRLIQEVDETRKKNPKLTYEAVTHMKYMDMVVSETLRKWPPVNVVDRVCTKPFTIEAQLPDEKPLHLEKDTLIWLPIISLHKDPNYYPNPDKFDPERFSDENKHKINPYAYIPFGSGVRNCIGSRFALLETKILFFYILSHFRIVPIEKTPIPIKLDPKNFTPSALGGFWLGLQKRTTL